MSEQNHRPGGTTLPPGMEQVFRCVRPVIFQDEASGLPAIPGTGFFVKLFGEIFFITARHVVDNDYDFNDEQLVIQYSATSNRGVPIAEVHRFRSTDENDTDHVDIVIYKTDRARLEMHLFVGSPPYDFSGKDCLRNYSRGMRLSFSGLSPDIGEYDYENRDYRIALSCGDLSYLEPESLLRSIHIGRVDVNSSFPDFDGLSGSPLFYFSSSSERSASSQFAGMLLRGTRSSGIMLFMEAQCVFNYLLAFFLRELPEPVARKKLEDLVKWYHPDIGYEYRPRGTISASNFSIRVLDGEYQRLL
ncbi:hypothetical protein [Massilia rhizosphaerae]|uniref:hypothetical protein n=1 Tax=Massilia rhizosphaerae TaxID=2784389 RepID=UPI0018DAFE1C|nr:hypothetical protein [Massilia rhizosphaerae]